MKTMNNNNGIENKNNSVKNNAAANEAAAPAKAVVKQCKMVGDIIQDVPVTEPVGERVGFYDDPEAYGGRVAVNEPKGWKVSKVLPFADAYNHYIKSHIELDEAVTIITQEIGIKKDDASEWANGLRRMIRGYVEHFVDFLDDEYFLDEVGDPDACDRTMTDMMFDAVVLECEVVDPYYSFEEGDKEAI